jgi:hypothetical protein
MQVGEEGKDMAKTAYDIPEFRHQAQMAIVSPSGWNAFLPPLACPSRRDIIRHTSDSTEHPRAGTVEHGVWSSGWVTGSLDFMLASVAYRAYSTITTVAYPRSHLL